MGGDAKAVNSISSSDKYDGTREQDHEDHDSILCGATSSVLGQVAPRIPPGH